MTKEEIKAFIELKQADMPFEVKDSAEALPLDGRDIVTISGVRRCGNSSRMEIAVNALPSRGVARMRTSELDLILEAYRGLNPDTELKDVEYNRTGGMPAVALTGSRSLQYERLQGCFDTMLLKDFVEHFGVKSPHVLRYFGDVEHVRNGRAQPGDAQARDRRAGRCRRGPGLRRPDRRHV